MTIQCQDRDGDTVAYEFEWTKNDGTSVGENKSVLGNQHFRKGDVVKVKVTPSDGKGKGEPFVSPEVRILNTPPTVQEVKIEPASPHRKDLLKAVVKGYDPDGDALYFTYQWEINGSPAEGETGETLQGGTLKKGDSVVVGVTPDDRESLGSPRKSHPVRIVNSPPVIVSAPPVSISGNLYAYQVKAEDPDEDPLTFSLVTGPKGMEMDPKTGLLRWEIRQEDKGTHSVELVAADDEKAKSVQRYTLAIDFRQP